MGLVDVLTPLDVEGKMLHAEDKDIPGFYEMFVFDPDGLRIEVAYGPPELDPLRQAPEDS